MGVDLFKTRFRAYRPRKEIEDVRTDVRSKTYVWMVVRRVNRGAYDIMGIWVDSPDADAETLAVSTCLDDSYYCGPIPVNVALPEKPVPWKGSYCPTRRAREVERRARSRREAKKKTTRRRKLARA